MADGEYIYARLLPEAGCGPNTYPAVDNEAAKNEFNEKTASKVSVDATTSISVMKQRQQPDEAETAA